MKTYISFLLSRSKSYDIGVYRFLMRFTYKIIIVTLAKIFVGILFSIKNRVISSTQYDNTLLFNNILLCRLYVSRPNTASNCIKSSDGDFMNSFRRSLQRYITLMHCTITHVPFPRVNDGISLLRDPLSLLLCDRYLRKSMGSTSLVWINVWFGKLFRIVNESTGEKNANNIIRYTIHITFNVRFTSKSSFQV